MPFNLNDAIPARFDYSFNKTPMEQMKTIADLADVASSIAYRKQLTADAKRKMDEEEAKRRAVEEGYRTYGGGSLADIGQGQTQTEIPQYRLPTAPALSDIAYGTGTASPFAMPYGRQIPQIAPAPAVGPSPAPAVSNPLMQSILSDAYAGKYTTPEPLYMKPQTVSDFSAPMEQTQVPAQAPQAPEPTQAQAPAQAPQIPQAQAPAFVQPDYMAMLKKRAMLMSLSDNPYQAMQGQQDLKDITAMELQQAQTRYYAGKEEGGTAKTAKRSIIGAWFHANGFSSKNMPTPDQVRAAAPSIAAVTGETEKYINSLTPEAIKTEMYLDKISGSGAPKPMSTVEKESAYNAVKKESDPYERVKTNVQVIRDQIAKIAAIKKARKISETADEAKLPSGIFAPYDRAIVVAKLKVDNPDAARANAPDEEILQQAVSGGLGNIIPEIKAWLQGAKMSPERRAAILGSVEQAENSRKREHLEITVRPAVTKALLYRENPESFIPSNYDWTESGLKADDSEDMVPEIKNKIRKAVRIHNNPDSYSVEEQQDADEFLEKRGLINE